MVNAMMQNPSRPSSSKSISSINSIELVKARTGTGHDLAFQPQLILIPPRDPTRLPALVNSNIRRPLDLIPHIPARERQDQADTGRAPDEARLDEREEERP